jgi:hypothetical protein
MLSQLVNSSLGFLIVVDGTQCTDVVMLRRQHPRVQGWQRVDTQDYIQEPKKTLESFVLDLM